MRNKVEIPKCKYRFTTCFGYHYGGCKILIEMPTKDYICPFYKSRERARRELEEINRREQYGVSTSSN